MAVLLLRMRRNNDIISSDGVSRDACHVSRLSRDMVFGRPFVERFAMLSDRCLSVLSVCLVYFDQTVIGGIKMPLVMEVGLGQARLC